MKTRKNETFDANDSNLSRIYELRTDYNDRNVLMKKSLAFSVRIVKLAAFLRDEARQFKISDQILNSGTSIGANANEAFHGESKADFEHKLAISQKEAKETKYWLDVIFASAIIGEESYLSLYSDCDELHKMVTSSILTSKSKPRSPRK